MKNLISERDYEKALEDGRSAMSREPYATAARFNSRTHLLSVEFSNGTVVGVDVRRAPVLRDFPQAAFSAPYVTPGGDGLLFEKSDLSVSIPGLLGPLLPEDIARHKIATVMGRMSSAKKAAAAQANGAKGGRPRKQPIPA